MLDYIDLNNPQTIELLKLDPISDNSSFLQVFKMPMDKFLSAIQRSRVYENNSLFIWIAGKKFCLYDPDPNDITFKLALDVINNTSIL